MDNFNLVLSISQRNKTINNNIFQYCRYHTLASPRCTFLKRTHHFHFLDQMIPLFSWGNDIILKGKTNPTFFFYNLNFLLLLYKNSIITTHMLLTKILDSCMYSRPSSTCPRCRESTFKYSAVIASIIKYIFKENHAKWWWQSIVLNS